jgi:hypothetical protein
MTARLGAPRAGPSCDRHGPERRAGLACPQLPAAAELANSAGSPGTETTR